MNGYQHERSEMEQPIQVTVGEDEQPSLAVVRAIADASGKSPTEIEPLFEYVSPESLDHLFENTPSTARRGTVTFSVDAYEISVIDGERVELRVRESAERT
ncbi:HalOD1 output domain-containing protein [Natrialbaceae archaeon A-arb3/5]